MRTPILETDRLLLRPFRKEDIRLLHLRDFTYYTEGCCIEVFVGKLNKDIEVFGDENELFWSDLDKDFSDVSKYVGNGNIDHILKVIKVG